MEYKIVNGAITYGSRTILEEINFDIRNHDKISIVGRNGSGKTSLIRAIIDNNMLESGLSLDEFKVIKIGNPSIGYLEQSSFNDLSVTLYDVIIDVYRDIIDIENRIKDIENCLSINYSDSLLNEYNCLLDKYKYMGGYEYKSEYEIVLRKFGFSDSDKYKRLSDFSGGQLTKIAFIRLLLIKPDILLLDEPTNHLDIDTVIWLEKYLKDYPKAIVIVSHDRMFLDNVCNCVYEISYSSLIRYNGNYSSYEIQKKMNYEKQMKDYEYQQKEIKRLTDIANRFRYKPSKASMAMSKLKKIEQMVIVDKPDSSDINKWFIDIKPLYESSYNVLSVKNLCVGYDAALMSNISFNLYSGDRVGIIGENGKGKSTLLKTIIGNINKISGKVSFGYNVFYEYFDQQFNFDDESLSIYDDFYNSFTDMDVLDIRKYLGRFLFCGDDIYKKISVLSGGERVRYSLCKIFKNKPNMLILDEPTNHLDIASKEILEEILSNYDGTILFVSHDRYFINKIAKSLLVFRDSNVLYYDGNYNDYVKNCYNVCDDVKEISVKKEKKCNVKNNSSNSRIKKIEKLIMDKENRISEIDKLMLEKEYYMDYEKINLLQKEKDSLNSDIDDLFNEWNGII